MAQPSLSSQPSARRVLHLASRSAPPPRRNPLALWHLLSLDAPTVATLWTGFIAHAAHRTLPVTSLAAMAIAVWLLYAADRLLDSRDSSALNQEARHRFHHRHRTAFFTGITAATLALAALLPTLAPEAIHLYLIEASFLTGYFILIHATSSAHRLPKELAVGPFFAAAIFIPTIARTTALRLPLLPSAILFAVLCSLNCLFIYAWEHPRPTAATHPATSLALRYLRPLAFILLTIALLLLAIDLRATNWSSSFAAGGGSAFPSSPTIPAAIALATTLLLLLDRYRHRIPPTTLRAAADLALLTPILFFLL